MAVGRRTLGRDGPSVSQISYGSMRIATDVTPESAAEFLCKLHEFGIDTHHSSKEYAAHSFYLDALRHARRTGRQFQHIVKVAEPSFDGQRFNSRRLTDAVENELQTLGAETIHSLQWLFRTPEPRNTQHRIELLNEQCDEISDCLATLIERGMVLTVSAFPYSVEFASAALSSGVSSILATYLNMAELEYLPLLPAVDSFIALRPLAGGRLTSAYQQDSEDPVDSLRARTYLEGLTDDRRRITAAMAFPLLHPAVATVVTSVNSVGHLEDFLTGCGTLPADSAKFESFLRCIS